MASDDVGVDYSGGTANVDRTTGIHYGVIHMNDLSLWAWEEFEADYGNPHCPKCGNDVEEYTSEYVDQLITDGVIVSEDELSDYTSGSCADYICESCGLILGSDHVYGDEPNGWLLDDGGYKAWIDQYNDVMITRSPYYTHAQFCSPCAPGAGHLAHPTANGPKTYCFGPEWFEGDKCPYDLYSVATGMLVRPAGQSVEDKSSWRSTRW